LSFVLFALSVPIAYSLGLAAIAGALWIGVPLEAVMLNLRRGQQVAMLTIRSSCSPARSWPKVGWRSARHVRQRS
jgi:hypothetical protein